MKGIYNCRTYEETLVMLHRIHAIGLFLDSIKSEDDFLSSGFPTGTHRPVWGEMKTSIEGNATPNIHYTRPMQGKEISTICILDTVPESPLVEDKNAMFYNRSKLPSGGLYPITNRGIRGLISGYHFVDAPKSGIRYLNMSYDSDEGGEFRECSQIDSTAALESYFMNSTHQSGVHQYLSFVDFYLREVKCPSLFVTYDAVDSVYDRIPLVFQEVAFAAFEDFICTNVELLDRFMGDF